MAQGISENEWNQMLAYSAAVFQNCGNYLSFGDTKFVPQLPQESFLKIVKASSGYAQNQSELDNILDKIMREVYTEAEPFSRIGFRDENNGTTSYYSSNVTKADAKFIDEWCQELDISPLNTRLFKYGENNFELLITSVEANPEKMKYLANTYTKGDKSLKITAADFKTFMEEVVREMKLAEGFAESTKNDGHQQLMVKDYIEHF